MLWLASGGRRADNGDTRSASLGDPCSRILSLSLSYLAIRRSHLNACAALLVPPYVRTGTLQPRGSRSARVVPRQPQPRGRVWTRGTGLPSRLRVPLSGGAGYSRGVVARTLRRRAARAGGVLNRPRLHDDVRYLCSRPWHESRRRAGAVWRHALVWGLLGRVASRSLASAISRKAASFRLSAAAVHRSSPPPQNQIANRMSSAAADQKLLHPILHGPAQVDKMRQTVLALAICGHAAALQPARAPRQSLAVRQAPRGVRQRVLDGVRGGDTREPTPSPRRHEGGDAREPPPSP